MLTAHRGRASLRLLSGSRGHNTRPLLLGYLHRGLMVTEDQVEAGKQELARFAWAEGFSLGVIFVEHAGTWPTAFEALIEAVIRLKVTTVALPSLFHFAAFGVPTDIRDSFERATGARVLVVRPAP